MTLQFSLVSAKEMPASDSAGLAARHGSTALERADWDLPRAQCLWGL